MFSDQFVPLAMHLTDPFLAICWKGALNHHYFFVVKHQERFLLLTWRHDFHPVSGASSAQCGANPRVVYLSVSSCSHHMISRHDPICHIHNRNLTGIHIQKDTKICFSFPHLPVTPLKRGLRISRRTFTLKYLPTTIPSSSASISRTSPTFSPIISPISTFIIVTPYVTETIIKSLKWLLNLKERVNQVFED
jgi:hypothetical protein